MNCLGHLTYQHFNSLGAFLISRSDSELLNGNKKKNKIKAACRACGLPFIYLHVVFKIPDHVL